MPGRKDKIMTREECKKLTDAEYNWLGTFALKGLKPALLRMMLDHEMEEVEARIKESPAHYMNNGSDRVSWFAPEGRDPEEWDAICYRLNADITYRNMLSHIRHNI